LPLSPTKVSRVAGAKSAWYNLGNALYRQQQLQESLEAFKQSLRLDPADTNAKHNLERVLQELQQQEDQQQQDQEQDDQQQDQQNEDQQNEDPQDDQQNDQEEPQDQPNQNQNQDEPGAEDGQGEPRQEPGQMTQEEAERLLDAVNEDPGDVDRRRAPATGRRPIRPW
jgi:tetratricopeptide (TPR) repeat protein